MQVLTNQFISSSVNWFGLSELTQAWAAAPAEEQSDLLRMGNVLLSIIDGTWKSSIMLFHGLPMIFSGLAVVSSGCYSGLLGWLGFAGGLGSLVAGPSLFFWVEGYPTGLSVFSAVAVSIYMLVLGYLLWNSES